MPIQLVGSRSFKALYANPIFAWEDVWAVFDDGSYAVPDYRPLEKMLAEQSQRFPDGLGCLVIIPKGASRIQDDVRAEINRVLETISVRCLCWAVLETGFRGATIQAILATMNLLGPRRRFPTHVTGSIGEAVAWIFPHLHHGQDRYRQIAAATAVFDQRLHELEKGR